MYSVAYIIDLVVPWTEFWALPTKVIQNMEFLVESVDDLFGSLVEQKNTLSCLTMVMKCDCLFPQSFIWRALSALKVLLKSQHVTTNIKMKAIITDLSV
jgi:hypothetical protein